MRTLTNPRWLFLINTLPVTILLFIFWRQYEVIQTLLSVEIVWLWKAFGFTLATLGLLHLAYTLWQVKKNKELSALYGIAALLLYAPFVYAYGQYSNELIPWSIPQWMASQNIILYVGTFLMPTMAHAIFIMVIRWTNVYKSPKAWVNFLLAIAVPIAGYAFSQIVLPLWQPVANDYYVHTLLILTIIGTIVFLFFLIRGIYIISFSKAHVWAKYQLLWKIPITILLPLLGLAINNGLILEKLQFIGPSRGIFGNFSSPWYYGLAIANGVLLCLPNVYNKTYRLALFVGRVISFAFTFYFFLVFLPYLPLSVIAIIAIGVGFLMLTPLLLFILHSNILYLDVKYLRAVYPKYSLILSGVLSFLVLPLTITSTYLQDKHTLTEALDYVYTPNFTEQPRINTAFLKRTLTTVNLQKERSFDFVTHGQTPYLSTFYNWLVLDNMTLSDTKINQLERVFFGEASFNVANDQLISVTNTKTVQITGTKVQSTYDASQQTWQSTLEIELTNTNTEGWNQEYETHFELPAGCWINDYYLWIEGRKEQGILAEKKAATWIYNQITTENRDPGILYYLTGNMVALKVFPFRAKEVRKTAISFIHKDPITLTIDSVQVNLGNNKFIPLQQTIGSSNGNVLYIPTSVKQQLPKVQRTPYYHFIIDGSVHKKNAVASYIKQINTFLQQDSLKKTAPLFTFANTYTKNITANWQEQLQQQTFEGGLFLDRAIKQILVQAYEKPTTFYPIIVVVTDSIENAVLEKGFADYQVAFPEYAYFYELESRGRLITHSLLTNPKWPVEETTAPATDVLAYPNAQHPVAFLPDNTQPSILIKTQEITIPTNEKTWLTALAMQGNWMQQTLLPQKGHEQWLTLVKASFLSKVMTPVTSYIAVENEAQKVMLKRKQEQVLSGNKSLDADEEAQRMSEPSIWMVLLLIGFVAVFKYRNRIPNLYS